MADQTPTGKKAELDPHMRRIVISLLKGGVAKSVTAVSLAHGLAMQGQKVLLVDTDVQAQCNDMLGVHPEKGLAQVIAGWKNPDDALVEARENLWLLAGGNDLAGVKMEIARREMSPEAVLDEALSQFEGQFDVMVMDTAPGWDTLLVNALYCSREVLSPVSMEPVALSGLMRFEERLEIIQKYNPQLKLKWIAPTFVDGRVKKSAEILKQLEERYGELLTPPVKYSVKLSEAPAFGRTIYEHDPKGVGAKAYMALTERIIADAPLRPTVASRLAMARPKPVEGFNGAADRPIPAMAPKVVRPVRPEPECPEPVRPKPARPVPVRLAPEPEPEVPAVAASAAPAEPEPAPVLKSRRQPPPSAEPEPTAAPPQRPRYSSLKERLGQVPPGQDAEAPSGPGMRRSPYLSLKERLKRGRLANGN